MTLDKSTKKFIAVVLGVLIGLILVLVGINQISVDSDPFWLNPAIGFSVIAASAVVWIITILYVRNN